MNVVVLSGRLTKDLELYQTESGTVYTKFNIAVDHFRRSGEKEADFPRVVAWGKQAENCVKYLSKGNKVGVIGRLATSQYDAKEGHRVFVTEVMAHSVEFMESKGTDQAQSEDTPDFDDSDIPF